MTLVGDAGYRPGPAVGGSASLAVYGAYERTLQVPVVGSRKLARLNTKGVRLYDTMPLPTWPAPLP